MKKTKNFAIHDEVYEHLRRRYDEHIKLRHENITFSAYVNRLLMDRLERERFVESYLPDYKLIGFMGDRMLIENDKTMQVNHIVVQSGTIKCLEDIERECCEHVAFAISTPEMARFYNQLDNGYHRIETKKETVTHKY